MRLAPMATSSVPSSLADEFLDDLGSLDGSAVADGAPRPTTLSGATPMELDTEEDEQKNGPTTPVQNELAARMLSEKIEVRIKRLIQRVQECESSDDMMDDVEDTKHALTVECVEGAALLDESIVLAHGELKKLYGRRFPELESLIIQPLDYARTVRVIAGREGSLASVDLTDILPSASAIGVQLAAATTGGMMLDEGKLTKVKSLSEEMLKMHGVRRRLLSFVEKNARSMAPNLCAVVGTKVAVLLIGATGGLEQLARIPGCNVKVLGAKKGMRGIGGKIVKQHEGFVFSVDLFEWIPPALREKLGRVIASKATLAARVDAGGSRDDTCGRKWRAEVEKKVENWQERAPAKSAKPLPVPDEVRKHKRGGKRKRKERELYEMTEVRKLANRVAFGKPEETYGTDFDQGLGMLGSEGNSRLRIQLKRNTSALRAANRKLEKISKRQRGSVRDPRIQSLTSFTPVQGMEFGMRTPAPGGITVGSLDAKDGTKSNYFSSATPFMGVEIAQRKERLGSDKKPTT